jgi:hypothetical protein
MNNDELIGKVAAEYLRVRLTEDDAGGVARYLLDCLTADQTAAIAKSQPVGRDKVADSFRW